MEGWGRGTRERRAGGWENTAVKTYVVVVVVWVGGVWVAGSMIKFKLGWVGGSKFKRGGVFNTKTKTHVGEHVGELYR